jgi:hypothetical protein
MQKHALSFSIPILEADLGLHLDFTSMGLH